MKCLKCDSNLRQAEDGWHHNSEQDHWPQVDWEGEAKRLNARVRALEDAVEMVMLFHGDIRWDESRHQELTRWMDSEVATPRALCNQLRSVRWPR